MTSPEPPAGPQSSKRAKLPPRPSIGGGGGRGDEENPHGEGHMEGVEPHETAGSHSKDGRGGGKAAAKAAAAAKASQKRSFGTQLEANTVSGGMPAAPLPLQGKHLACPPPHGCASKEKHFLNAPFPMYVHPRDCSCFEIVCTATQLFKGFEYAQQPSCTRGVLSMHRHHQAFQTI